MELHFFYCFSHLYPFSFVSLELLTIYTRLHANCSADTLLETGSYMQIYSLISTPPLSLSCVVGRFSWTLFQAEDIQTFRSYFSLLVKRADDDDNIIPLSLYLSFIFLWFHY